MKCLAFWNFEKELIDSEYLKFWEVKICKIDNYILYILTNLEYMLLKSKKGEMATKLFPSSINNKFLKFEF